MSSSDRRRAAGEARAAAEAATRAAAVTGSENGAADAEELDPWFGAGPKAPAGADSAWPADGGDTNEPASSADAADTAQWFLRTGRAGLMPESMTVSADEDESGTTGAHYPAQIQAAGAPPWAREAADTAAGEPPPWETGPWPGPGEHRASDRAMHGSAASPARAGQPVPGSPPASGMWSARTVLASGLVPLVIPGLVVGVLGLGRSKPGEPIRRASILAIAASLAWAVIIVVVVASTSGSPATSCQYPVAVRQAYARAMADLTSHARASVTAADLGLAATRANASAAATGSGDITARSALFAMTADLQQARTDVVGNRPVPASLRAHLAADQTALTASCSS